jgi:hypothetical protein
MISLFEVFKLFKSPTLPSYINKLKEKNKKFLGTKLNLNKFRKPINTIKR